MVAGRAESSAAESRTQQLRRRGRGHQHVHAVVAARAALLDRPASDCRWASPSSHIEPGSSASMPNGCGSESEPSLTEIVPCHTRSGPPPQAIRTRMSSAISRVRRQRQQRGQRTTTDSRHGRSPCGRQTASLRCSRTSVSDHRRPRRWCNIQKIGADYNDNPPRSTIPIGRELDRSMAADIDRQRRQMNVATLSGSKRASQ